MEGVLGNVLEQVPMEGVSGKGNDLSLGVVGMGCCYGGQLQMFVKGGGHCTVKKKKISVLKNIIHIYNIGLKIRLFIFLIF